MDHRFFPLYSKKRREKYEDDDDEIRETLRIIRLNAIIIKFNVERPILESMNRSVRICR